MKNQNYCQILVKCSWLVWRGVSSRPRDSSETFRIQRQTRWASRPKSRKNCWKKNPFRTEQHLFKYNSTKQLMPLILLTASSQSHLQLANEASSWSAHIFKTPANGPHQRRRLWCDFGGYPDRHVTRSNGDVRRRKLLITCFLSRDQ